MGGVDLSTKIGTIFVYSISPRPCGRGGFKLDIIQEDADALASPPVWAGWI